MSILKNKLFISNTAAFRLWMIALAALVVLSLLPPGNEPEISGLVNDKVRHFTAYAVVALLACLAGRNWHERLILCFITFMISIAIEFLQPLTGREFEVWDMVANFSGIVAGMGVMAPILRRRERKERMS